MLEVHGLVKIYGTRRVVDQVDFHVDQGEIVGLLGPNGAGKTTCFRMTCGMLKPNAGQVILGEHDVTEWPMYRRARDGGMGYLAQESSVFRKLTVEKNLLGVMEMLGFSRRRRRDRCEELLEQFGISRLRKSLAMSLSGGERRRLEIARCLVSNPRIILLDEPFTGIDPVTIASIQKIVRELRSAGISILITDHQVRETLQITDRSYVIKDGQVLCQGTRDEVLANRDAIESYFGENIGLGLADPAPPIQDRGPALDDDDENSHAGGGMLEPSAAASTARETTTPPAPHLSPSHIDEIPVRAPAGIKPVRRRTDADSDPR